MRRSPLAVCLVVVALFALAAAHDHHVAKNTKDSKVSSSASEQSAVPWTAPDACRRMPHFLLETLTRNRTLAAFARSRHLSAERASWAIEATADAADASFEHMSAEALAVSGSLLFPLPPRIMNLRCRTHTIRAQVPATLGCFPQNNAAK